MNNELLKLEPMVQMMLRNQIKDSSPNTLLAYVIFIFLGWCGIHLFYLAYKSSGKLRTTFLIGGLCYLFTFAFGGVMLLLDLFLTALYCKMVKEDNEKVIVDEYLIANGMKSGNVTPEQFAGSLDKWKVADKYDDNIWEKK